MTTIEDVLAGKAEYFKIEDFGNDSFQIMESIDPGKTDIRCKKVPNKNKKGTDDRETIDYFSILVKFGDAEKDVSFTFTALKQLAQIMPRHENWRGYKIKFLGKKGSGKNITYNFVLSGKDTVEQSRLDTNAPVDMATRVLASLAQAPSGLQDAPFWADVGKIVPNLSEASELIERLKKEGRIVNLGGVWKAIK